jgi:4-oxalocrotonate tautomerase
MPIVTIKVFEGELTTDQTAEIIADITEAVIPYVGEAVRANTWVLVEEVRSGSWGIGGKAFRLADLRQIQESAPPDQQPYSRREPTNNRREKS